MAYKQIPGRGNHAKTGHGIPAPFKQEGQKTQKAKESIEKRTAFGTTYDEQKSAEKFAVNAPQGKVASGTEFNSRSGKVIPKTFEKKLQSGKEIGLENSPNDMFITDSAGKIVKKAEARNPKAVEALKKEYSSMKGDTEDARKANSMTQNYSLSVAGGAKSPAMQMKGGAKKPMEQSKKMVSKDAKTGTEKKSPAMQKVSKKTAYDIKEASNQKLKPGARKHYAENAQAAMKNKKTPAKMKKC